MESALFLVHNGEINSTITGLKRRSTDVPKGGLELPLPAVFTGVMC